MQIVMSVPNPLKKKTYLNHIRVKNNIQLYHSKSDVKTNKPLYSSHSIQEHNHNALHTSNLQNRK